MKVTLTNFITHKYLEIEFSNGLNLVKGKSGVGKSSIQEGICWCLYGGKCTYTKQGETTCKVTIDYKNVRIERTSKPSTIHLFDEYGKHEGAESQSIIDKIFGKNFRIFGYMPQSSSTQQPFILMNAAEKFNLLEKIVHGDEIDIQESKLKLKKLKK